LGVITLRVTITDLSFYEDAQNTNLAPLWCRLFFFFTVGVDQPPITSTPTFLPIYNVILFYQRTIIVISSTKIRKIF
jgi:hypothetical protein